MLIYLVEMANDAMIDYSRFVEKFHMIAITQ